MLPDIVVGRWDDSISGDDSQGQRSLIWVWLGADVLCDILELPDADEETDGIGELE